MDERDIRDLLERLGTPPEDPDFFRSLRERLRERDRTAVRRWRVAAVALAAVAAAAVAAAAVVATARGGGARLDRTLSCSLAGATTPGVGVDVWPQSDFGRGGLRVFIGGHGSLLRLRGSVPGFALDPTRCRAASVDVSTDGAGLDDLHVVGPGVGRVLARCLPSGRVLLRMQVGLDPAGRPDRATVAVAARDGTPLAVLRWQPSLVRAALGRSCPGG